MSMALQPELVGRGWAAPPGPSCTEVPVCSGSGGKEARPPGVPRSAPPCVCAGVTGGHREGLLSTLLSAVFAASQPRESSCPGPPRPPEHSPGCRSWPGTPMSWRGPWPPHRPALLSPEAGQVPDTPLGMEDWLASQGTEATSLQRPCSGCVCHVPA